MGKFKKLICMLCVLIAAAGVFAACGDPEGEDDNTPPGYTNYTFEAEGIDLYGLSGRGYSNEASECQMIQGQNTKSIRENSSVINSISNGYFVGFFTTPETELTFNLTSAAASEENILVLRLGSEWGTLKIDESVMKIVVNGTELDYNEISVVGQKVSGANIVYAVPFADYEISARFNLKEGANTVKLIIQSNELGVSGFPSVGPGVDCLKIKSKAALSWESIWEDNKTEIVNEQ